MKNIIKYLAVLVACMALPAMAAINPQVVALHRSPSTVNVDEGENVSFQVEFKSGNKSESYSVTVLVSGSETATQTTSASGVSTDNDPGEDIPWTWNTLDKPHGYYKYKYRFGGIIHPWIDAGSFKLVRGPLIVEGGKVDLSFMPQNNVVTQVNEAASKIIPTSTSSEKIVEQKIAAIGPGVNLTVEEDQATAELISKLTENYRHLNQEKNPDGTYKVTDQMISDAVKEADIESAVSTKAQEFRTKYETRRATIGNNLNDLIAAYFLDKTTGVTVQGKYKYYKYHRDDPGEGNGWHDVTGSLSGITGVTGWVSIDTNVNIGVSGKLSPFGVGVDATASTDVVFSAKVRGSFEGAANIAGATPILSPQNRPLATARTTPELYITIGGEFVNGVLITVAVGGDVNITNQHDTELSGSILAE